MTLELIIIASVASIRYLAYFYSSIASALCSYNIEPTVLSLASLRKHFITLRNHGIMVSWYHGIMVSWYHGIMESWYHGIMVSWYHGIMESWYHSRIINALPRHFIFDSMFVLNTLLLWLGSIVLWLLYWLLSCVFVHRLLPATTAGLPPPRCWPGTHTHTHTHTHTVPVPCTKNSDNNGE